MKTADVRKKNREDLTKLLLEKQEELRGLMLGSTVRTKNVHTARELKKVIARIKTVLHEETYAT